jgi:hypothetical protein
MYLAAKAPKPLKFEVRPDYPTTTEGSLVGLASTSLAVYV